MDTFSISWTTKIGDRELSRTVYAQTAETCIWMMNAIEEADAMRGIGMFPVGADQAHNPATTSRD